MDFEAPNKSMRCKVLSPLHACTHAFEASRCSSAANHLSVAGERVNGNIISANEKNGEPYQSISKIHRKMVGANRGDDTVACDHRLVIPDRDPPWFETKIMEKS